MAGGAIATITSLLALCWAKEIVGGVLSIFGAPREEAVKTVTITFAVLMVYVLDFAINVVQAGVRAFIVDNAPAHQQELPATERLVLSESESPSTSSPRRNVQDRVLFEYPYALQD